MTKELRIRINNMNGYAHTISGKSFNERMIRTFKDAKDENYRIWGIEEVATGGKTYPCIKATEKLADKYGYKCIIADEEEDLSNHPRSTINALLLRDVKEYEVLETEKVIELYRRINYVRVVFNDMPEEEFFIIHVHTPQTDYFPGRKDDDKYVKIRIRQAKQFREAVRSEVEKLIKGQKNVILLGDFNETLNSIYMKGIQELGMTPVSDKVMRTYYGLENNRGLTIDHILLSKNITDHEAFGVKKSTVDGNFVTVNKLSDHATVIVHVKI